MCTISWIPEPGGYRLWMNRDEARSRAAARGPRALRLRLGSAVAPLDPQGGGSWIGATAGGMSLALANAYAGLPASGAAAAKAEFGARTGPVSRGLLLMEALGRGEGEAVRRMVAEKDLSAYRPFRLCVFEPDAPVRRLDWDGEALSETMVEEAGLVATSSSWQPEEVARRRAALFRRAGRECGGFSAALLDRLHASREPEPGPWAVSMERPDAATVSLSRIKVSEAEVTFWYAGGPPHRTEAGPPRVLVREAAPCEPVEECGAPRPRRREATVAGRRR